MQGCFFRSNMLYSLSTVLNEQGSLNHRLDATKIRKNSHITMKGVCKEVTS